MRHALGILAVALVGVSGAVSQVVTFEDPALEAAVRAELFIPVDPILAADMLGLVSLDVSTQFISSLAGLEYATNLTHLNLSGNALNDFSPLQSLTSLVELDLSSSINTPNLTLISGLANLKYLYLGGDGLSNIAPLSSLVGLIELDLSFNSISIVAALSNLTELTVLNLEYNSITDLTPLAGIPFLENLSLFNNDIKEISALVANAGLDSGDFLDLGGNPLSPRALCEDIPALQTRGVSVQYDGSCASAPISIPDDALELAVRNALSIPTGGIYPSDMTSLTSLDASSSGISDLTGLEYATNLTSLDLSDNNISDVTPLSGLTNLQTLHLSRNNNVDVTPLSGLTSLHVLWLSSNNIVDVTPLSGLIELTFLDLDYNSIMDVTPLSNLTNLTQLWLNYNSITDLAPLSSLAGLTRLDLRQNNVSDLEPLSSLTNLTRTDLRENAITDLSPLSGLASLTSLQLWDNAIVDVAPLSGLTNLSSLTLFRNNIREIGSLIANSGLGAGDVLSLSENPLSPRALCEDIPTLELRGFLSLTYDGACTSAAISIPDVDLEQAIRIALDIPSGGVYPSDMSALTSLDASAFGIADLASLEAATNLSFLDLSENSIVDIAALVANGGLGSGDVLILTGNPLSQTALCDQIPALEGRGVTVTYDGTCDQPVLQASPPSRSVSAAAGSTDFAITNSGTGALSWSAAVTSGAEWLSVAPFAGSAPATLSATYTENTASGNRIGTITVTAPGADNSPASVTVTQQGVTQQTLPTVTVGPPSPAITNTLPVEFAVS